MDVSNPRSRIGGSRTAQLLSSRRGALTVAVVAALAAGALFYAFAQNYKTNTPPVLPPVNTFVAQKLIPQGAAGQVISAEGLLKTVQVPGAKAVAGAVSSLSSIAGQVTTGPIAAGQTLTAADFTRANITISSYLSGDQRAIALPLDAAHGLTAFVQQGDTIDVMETAGAATSVLAQNITVLSNSAGDIVLRVSDKQALTIANASDNAKIWLTLRPPVQAQQTVTVGSSATAAH